MVIHITYSLIGVEMTDHLFTLTLLTDGKEINSETIVCSIIDNNYYVEFLDILERECSFTFKRLLQPCGKII
jgi:hypothetical protein